MVFSYTFVFEFAQEGWTFLVRVSSKLYNTGLKTPRRVLGPDTEATQSRLAPRLHRAVRHLLAIGSSSREEIASALNPHSLRTTEHKFNVASEGCRSATKVYNITSCTRIGARWDSPAVDYGRTKGDFMTAFGSRGSFSC